MLSNTVRNMDSVMYWISHILDLSKDSFSPWQTFPWSWPSGNPWYCFDGATISLSLDDVQEVVVQTIQISIISYP